MSPTADTAKGNAATQSDTTKVNDTVKTTQSPATTPPMPFPAERLIGGHEKVNFFDFAQAMLVPFLQGNLAAISVNGASFANNFSQKLLSDSQNLAVKIQTDAATAAQTIQNATANAVGTLQGLVQQNLNPVSQGEGESADSQSYPPNRGVDSGTAQSVLTNVTSQLGHLTTQVVGLAQSITNGNAAITALLAQLVENSKQQPKAATT